MKKPRGCSSAAVEDFVVGILAKEASAKEQVRDLVAIDTAAPCQYETWRDEPNSAEDSVAFPYLIRSTGGRLVAQVATDQLCEESKDAERVALICAAPQLLAHLNMLLFAIENGVEITVNHAAYVVGSQVARKASGHDA